MNVLIYGAGRFAKATADEFAKCPDSFNEVTVVFPQLKAWEETRPNVRFQKNLPHASPEIVVISASKVPTHIRQRLARKLAPIDEFWRLEREYNLKYMRTLVPWLNRTNWKTLIVETNPVHEWVAAFHTIWPRRSVAGLGTAFDSSRVKGLIAAMYPGREVELFHRIQVFGGHGTALVVSNGQVSEQVARLAKWISNTVSVMLIYACDDYASLWWKTVAIDPLVRGLAGINTETHLVTPITYRHVHGVTGIKVLVRGLNFRPIQPRQLSPLERTHFLDYLRQSAKVGTQLARKLTSFR